MASPPTGLQVYPIGQESIQESVHSSPLGPSRQKADRQSEFSLQGSPSNRQGIGARVIAHLDKTTIRRELFPVANFLSQAPARITLGLHKAKRIDRLEIHWPSGTVQVLEDLPVNRRLHIRENDTRPR